MGDVAKRRIVRAHTRDHAVFRDAINDNVTNRKAVDGGGGGGDDGRMEKRLEGLEQANLETRDRLARIETRLEDLVTKGDLHGALHSLTWKIIGSCGLLVAATYVIAKFVH